MPRCRITSSRFESEHAWKNVSTDVAPLLLEAALDAMFGRHWARDAWAAARRTAAGRHRRGMARLALGACIVCACILSDRMSMDYELNSSAGDDGAHADEAIICMTRLAGVRVCSLSMQSSLLRLVCASATRGWGVTELSIRRCRRHLYACPNLCAAQEKRALCAARYTDGRTSGTGMLGSSRADGVRDRVARPCRSRWLPCGQKQPYNRNPSLNCITQLIDTLCASQQRAACTLNS